MNLTFAQDPSAAQSPTGVLQARFPQGFTSGVLGNVTYRKLSPTPRMYVGVWWKASDPWEAPGSTIQYMSSDKDGHISMALYDSSGVGAGPYKLQVAANGWLTQNMNPNVSVTLGEWHLIEWYADFSDTLAVIRWWLDGVLLADYDTVAVPPGVVLNQYSMYIEWHQWKGAKPQDDFFWYDHTRISIPSASGDTTRPAMPDSLNLPVDGVLTVSHPGDTLPLYYRSILAVGFDSSASGPVIREILDRYNAQVIGGAPYMEPNGEYVLQLPDPGPTFEALDSLAERLENESGVEHVSLLVLRDVLDPRYRRPIDGPNSTRGAWLPGAFTDATRPRVAIRAPLAWGCENGTSAGDPVRLGVMDLVFPSVHPDFAGSAVTVSRPRGLLVPHSLLNDPVFRSHGTAVGGIMGATGDNGQGVAGLVWRTNLTLYAYGAGLALQPGVDRRFGESLGDARARGIRIVVTSTGLGSSANARQIRDLRRAIHRYVTTGAGNLFVYAAGQHQQSITLQQLQTTTSPLFTALDRAVAQLFDSLPGRIIIVSGSDSQDAFWAQSDYYAGATHVAAPATDVETLAEPADFSTGTFVRSGTSYAAPFVAGVAAQLLAMDPTLTAPAMTDYILRGTRMPRVNAATGQIEVPQPIAGSPDVFLLDAYGSLTLLASERQGAPLCGNRIWSADGRIWVQRDTTLREAIANPGQTATRLTVLHGGRRIEYGLTNPGENDTYYAVDYTQGVWQPPVQIAGLTIGQNLEALGGTLPGGTARATTGVSHEGDTLLSAYVSGLQGENENPTLPVTLYRYTGGGAYTPSANTSITTGLSRAAPTCAALRIETDRYSELCESEMYVPGDVRLGWGLAVYPQVGDTAFVILSRWRATRAVTITREQMWSFDLGDTATFDVTKVALTWRPEKAQIYRIAVPSLGGLQLLREIPDSAVYWAGLAEDGSQSVVAVGTGEILEYYNYQGDEVPVPPYAREDGCVIEYRDPRMVAVADARDRIAAGGACVPIFGGEWNGTIAPAPRRGSVRSP